MPDTISACFMLFHFLLMVLSFIINSGGLNIWLGQSYMVILIYPSSSSRVRVIWLGRISTIPCICSAGLYWGCRAVTRRAGNYNFQTIFSVKITNFIPVFWRPVMYPYLNRGSTLYQSHYSVDSIKRTVQLAFHGLFSLSKILFTNSKQYF